MPCPTSALSVMLLMAVTLCTVCESALPTVKLKLHDPAVLPCTGRCSGLVRWTMFSKSSAILAQCDQTECRSVKEGYQMIYNQYLQGNLSLIITEADFSKRGTYTCNCDRLDLCDVQLQIEPLKTTVQKRPGETLVLDLHISDHVEVIYSSTDPAKPFSCQICTVEKRSVLLSCECSERTSVPSVLELREVTESDSGVYTVRDTFNKEIIHIYTVIVRGESEAHGQEKNSGQEAALPGWVCGVLGGLVVLLLVVCVVSVVLIWVKLKKCLQRESARKRHPQDVYSNLIIDHFDNSCPEQENVRQK